jgi:formylglycine-generating enzyme required for sulfatase activity
MKLRLVLVATVIVAAVTLESAEFAKAGRAAAKAPAAVKAGQTFKECRNCPEMIVVPAGSFVMGSPAAEANRRDNETPHKVSLARRFAVGRTEITWDQWEACVRDRGCDGIAVENALRSKESGEPNPDFVDWGRGTRPVVGVNWFDAEAYVGWLNRKTGNDDAYRLLSDAEFEYVARGGTTTAYPWGEKIDHDHGNFGIEGPGLGGKAEGRDVWLAQTAPVASFPPNAFGVSDMHGNVFEWVEDCYEADRAHAPDDGSADKQGNCANRVFRSGSFISNPYMHRSAKRQAPYPSTRRGRNYLGFRVAKTLE